MLAPYCNSGARLRVPRISAQSRTREIAPKQARVASTFHGKPHRKYVQQYQRVLYVLISFFSFFFKITVSHDNMHKII